MFTHSTVDEGRPPQCRRCGGVLHEPVSFCIYCGIFHPLDAELEQSVVSRTRPSAASTASKPIASASDSAANVIQSLLQASNLVVPEAKVAPIVRHPLALSIKHQSLRTKGAALCVVSILAFGVLWLWMTHRSTSIVGDSALDAALTTPADAQRLQSDQASLESRREAALRKARSCAKDGKWDCVRVGASDALAIDAGSAEAQALLQRAIVASGWMPLTRRELQTAGESNPALAPHTATQSYTLARRYTNTPKSVPGGASAGGADGVGSVAGDDGDAEMRAIVESGWKHPSNNGVSVPKGGDVAGH